MAKTESLEPAFRLKISELVMGAEIATGLDWIVTSCRRTMAEQQAIYQQGRTTPGKVVTKAPPGYSAHNYGLAADLAPMKDGKIWWNAPDIIWQQMADVAVKLGLDAGYYFKSFKDMPHVEDKSWKDRQAKWKAGEINIP